MDLYKKFKDLKYWFSNEKSFYSWKSIDNKKEDIEKYNYMVKQYNKLLDIEKQALIEYLEKHPHILDDIKRIEWKGERYGTDNICRLGRTRNLNRRGI